MHLHLQEIKGNKKPFGGLNMVCVGDSLGYLPRKTFAQRMFAGPLASGNSYLCVTCAAGPELKSRKVVDLPCSRTRTVQTPRDATQRTDRRSNRIWRPGKTQLPKIRTNGTRLPVYHPSLLGRRAYCGGP